MKANDRVLAKDCQLFIITNRSAFAAIDELAGRMAATRPDRVIPVLKYRMESDVLLIVMPVDSGQCLTDYMVDTAKPLSYSAIRSIIGECANVLREVIADTPSGIVITTDTVRVTTSGVQIADAPMCHDAGPIRPLPICVRTVLNGMRFASLRHYSIPC